MTSLKLLVIISYITLQKLRHCQSQLVNLTEFFVECPCLTASGNELKTVKSPSVESCYVACMATSSCSLFSSCDMTKVCSMWNNENSGLSWFLTSFQQCNRVEPVTSKRRWYVPTAAPSRSVQTCKDLKEANPAAADGYYLAKLRGIKFEVFCVMSEAGDALTYIDVDAWTEFNSGPTQQARMIFEKVRLIADNCIMVLDSNDYRFANQIVSAGSTSDEDVQTNGLLRGKGCLSLPSKRLLDLSGTPFSFQSNFFHIYFVYNGPAMNSTSVQMTRQRLYTEGIPPGNGCSRGSIYLMENGFKREVSFYPLQLYR
ncbi:uncharacterized protein LOC142347104 [Convolutriloba macropyga]|uniref:uncharacterized protein LOC142347104 n=1 Tax=Convolutriloba macropyga TaxID=536237 RepID=UPI003F522FDB